MSGIMNMFVAAKTTIATAVDAFFNSVSLLLNTSSTNGAQNNTFLDSSTNNFTITRNGNATQGTFTPFSQTGWSNYFNGSNTELTCTGSALSGQFTMEGWVYYTSTPSTGMTYFGISSDNGGYIRAESSTQIGFVQGAVGPSLTGSFTPVVGVWYHIAVTRNASNLMTIWVNGSSVATGTVSTSYASGTFAIGANHYSGGTTGYFPGYISNVRLVTGSALYTSTFTPSTTPLTAITNTQLLTCQSNRFVDNSSNAFAITVNGTPSVQAFSPFLPTAAYDAAVVGGSGYFDGSGDYLTVPANSAFNFNSGDFTLETWLYMPSVSSNQEIFAQGSGTFAGIAVYITSTGKVHLDLGNGSSWYANAETTNSVKANSWTHIAIVRQSTTYTIYLNGVSDGTTTTATFPTDASGSISYIGIYGPLTSQIFTGYMSGFRIVKGTGGAIYTSNFTPPTAPPTAVTNTSLLANFTNAGIYDSASKSSWETVNNVQVSTAQAKWGTTSIYFPGSTSNQRLLPSQNYQFDIFGTGDFTIECWLYVIAQGATTVSGLWDQRPGVNGTYINWVVDFGGYGQGSSSNPKLVLYTNSAVLYASGVLTMGTWNHVALCRASGTTRMFINGTLSGTAVSDTNNYLGGGSAGNYRPSIGSTDGGDSLYGYIDDFRVTRYARYTTNFTAPTAAFGTQ